MTNEKLFDKNGIEVTYDDEEHLFRIKMHAEESFLEETEMLEFLMVCGQRVLLLEENTGQLVVGDRVKVLGNAPGTAWENGAIEQINGDMAYIVYGIKSLGEFGGLRGQGFPVPLSKLRKIP